ncbi:MAG TPA: HD domain-containing protein [Anaerolineaceae bacterium]|nr:HD domain-containing protein [Anaerolineaceae bacterium]
MVKIQPVKEIRPRLTDEFSVGPFVPRTEAMAVAYRWGQQMHSGQKRLSGEPYFETHCGWVAAFLDHLVCNEAWTIAGLLHDSVEDSGGTLDQIRAMFPGVLGEEVAYIIDGVTKLSSPRDGRSRELETLRKIAMFRDPAVFLVKLADKSHNVMTLGYMPEKKRRKKAEEAIRAYGKLAGILNCYKWRRWLEDMAFPHYEPQTFAYVKSRIDRDPRLNPDFINPILKELARIMDETGIDGRVEIIVNGYWQAWQKLRRMARLRKTSLESFSAVNDLVSFRMIVNDNDHDACYRLMGKVSHYFGPLLDQSRFDDFIASPQNGYRAIQLTAWLPEFSAIEVAIATDAMEGENLWGVVYALQHGQDISAYRPVEILTPTGGARFLPEGATVLDAIASIQQEFLLDKISSVEVNGSPAHLYDHVNPGDVVEVITHGPRLVPTEEWLSYCNASTAQLLRAVLATEALRNTAEQGRQIIKTILSSRGLVTLEDLQALERDKTDNLLEQLSCASLEDLYAAVGGGAIRLEDVVAQLDRFGITKEGLGFITINLIGESKSNRPGVFMTLAGLIFNRGGNIMRSVNDTFADGSYNIRLVVKNILDDQLDEVQQDFKRCGIEFRTFEIV